MSETGIDASFFGSPDYVPVRRDVDIKSARTERGILPDAQKRLGRLLEKKGWEQIRDVVGGGKLPTLEEWVDYRITNRRGTNFFPSFIMDERGKIFFLKTQVSKDPVSLKSLANEATILKEFNEMGYPSPTFHEYGQGDGETLAFIRLAAITPDQGRVAAAADWQEKHAILAIKQIRKMEEADLGLLPRKLTEMDAFQTKMSVTETMVDLVQRAGKYVPDEMRGRVGRLLEMGGEVRTVLAHGDMALKNIVIDNKGGVLPVDFESAKVGFLGQDAGKLLSDLRGNPEVFKVALARYVDDGSGGIDQNRLRALIIGMVTQHLVHIVWRADNRTMDAATLGEIKTFVEKIKDALSIKELF